MSSSSSLSNYIPIPNTSTLKGTNDSPQIQNFLPLHLNSSSKYQDSDKDLRKCPPHAQPKGDSGLGASGSGNNTGDFSPKKSTGTEGSPIISSSTPEETQKKYFCHTCQKKIKDVFPNFSCQYCLSTFVEEVESFQEILKVEMKKSKSAEVRVKCHNCQKKYFAILEEDLKCEFCQSKFVSEMSDEESNSHPKSQTACEPNAFLTYLCHNCDRTVKKTASSKLECPLCQKGALELVMNPQKSVIDRKISEMYDDKKLGVAAGGERDLNIMNVWNEQKKISNQTQKLQKNRNVKPSYKNTAKAKNIQTPTEAQRIFFQRQKKLMQNCQASPEQGLPGPAATTSSIRTVTDSRNILQKLDFPPLPKPKNSIKDLLKNQQSLMNSCQKNIVPKPITRRPTAITQFIPIEKKMLDSFEQFTSTPKLSLRKTQDNLGNLDKFNESPKSKDNGRFIKIGSYLKQSTRSNIKQGKKDFTVKGILEKKRQPISSTVVHQDIVEENKTEDGLGQICKFYQQGTCKYGKICPFRHIEMYSPLDEIETVSLIDTSQSSISSMKLEDGYDENETMTEKQAFEYDLPNKKKNVIKAKFSSPLVKSENISQCSITKEQKLTKSSHQIDYGSKLVKRNDQLKTKDESKIDNKSNRCPENESKVIQSNLNMEEQTSLSGKIEKCVEDSITDARSCQLVKNYEGAVNLAREGLKHSGHNSELSQILAHGLMMTGKLNESLQVSNALIEWIDNTSTPDDVIEWKVRSETLYLVATIMTRLEKTDDAIQILENLSLEQPNHLKAKDKLVKLKQLATDNKTCEVYCSQAEQQLDDPEKALKILNKALALPTSSRDTAYRILNLLGRVTGALGMYEEAEKHLTSIIELENWGGEWRLGTERMRNALVERGKSRAKLGKVNLASQDLKKAYIVKQN